jgi:hypothetical protein
MENILDYWTELMKPSLKRWNILKENWAQQPHRLGITNGFISDRQKDIVLRNIPEVYWLLLVDLNIEKYFQITSKSK